jgi:serine/threonine protein kinase
VDWPEVERLPEWSLYRHSVPRPSRLLEHLQQNIPESYADSIDLLIRILTLTPSKRISAEEARKHPFLARFGTEIDHGNLPSIATHPEVHQMGVSTDRKKNQK